MRFRLLELLSGPGRALILAAANTVLTMGKFICFNHGKSVGKHRKPRENHGKPWDIYGKTEENVENVTYCDFPLSIPHPLKVQVNVMCIALMMPPSPFARWKQLEQALVGMRKVTERIVNGMPLMV